MAGIGVPALQNGDGLGRIAFASEGSDFGIDPFASVGMTGWGAQISIAIG